MGNIASIHIEKGHIGEFFHNDRSKETKNSIFRDGEVIYTLSAEKAIALYKQDLEKKSKIYTERTGQKLQKKAITLLSAVVNIKPDTTLDDLKRLGQELEKKLGTRIYQIAIHRDEGHINEKGEKIVNEHAHILMSGLDEEGRSVRRKLTKKILRELQDLTAQTLGMERGKSVKQTKRKRLDTYEYKEAMKLKNAEVVELKKELDKKNQEVKDLKKQLVEKDSEIEELKVTKKDLEEQIKQLREQMKAFNKKLEEQEKEKVFTQADYKALSEIKKLLNAKDLNEAKEKLKITKREMVKRMEENKQLKSKINVVINKFNSIKTDVKRVEEENTKLKQENKELKETITKLVDELAETKARISNNYDKAKKIVKKQIQKDYGLTI